MSPAASTARPLVARTLRRTSRSMPLIPMALRRPPIVVGIRQTSSETRTGMETLTASFWPGGRFAVPGEEGQAEDGEQKDRRQRDEQNIERDFVGRLLPRCALDQRDHAVDERMARLGCDSHDDAVREDASPAGHRAAVASAFPDDGGRFAGDGRFIDAGDSFDDFAIAGNDVARFANHQIANLQLRGGNSFLPVAAQSPSEGMRSERRAATPPGPCHALPPSPRQSWRRAR